jgi:hypothetical protein
MKQRSKLEPGTYPRRKNGVTGKTGRGAQGDYLPRAPTDPDVRISRIGLVIS